MQLGKTYIPSHYEDEIYKLWEKSGAFKPVSRGSNETFSMVMPPPNANANIHIGTAITLGLEDIAARYNRMLGKATLYVPGADHAGIETQFVYEKHLVKEGKSRLDFTRDELYKQVWEFVEKNKKGYETQFRKLGVSADWSRYVYTLDDKIVHRAYKTFKKMWDDKLIYRGERLVNFCTFHGTSFADIEVVYEQEKSHLWHIRYPLTDGSGEVIVATTRPETMFGDTAVAVHPNDKRYKKYIGKTVKLPLTAREIPILADEMVEAEFGTGAVKITPAHDPNDYEVAQRHDLPLITVIDFAGNMNHEVPQAYQGLPAHDARKEVVNDLRKQDFLDKEESYDHSVGKCYKCGTTIQPLLREQWFVDMQPLAKRAIEILEQKKIVFYPDSKRLQLIEYLKGLRDWNISRQNAWGIPIPAFRNAENPDDWIFDERVDREEITVNGRLYHRDPDVFDTWFSSSSWPYATLGYPDNKDFKEFYPLDLMETGGEILYPWVARMIMLGDYITGNIPFKAVYIHGYVMSVDGRKMSKSLGNVIDPLPIIETMGSDALRMGLIAGRTPAVNRAYDASKIEGARNFCNKLWNIARYAQGVIGDDAALRTTAKPQTIADYWMLSKLQQSSEKIGSYLDDYNFAEAYETLYHLVWDDFADWYIEASKGQGSAEFLAYCLETILKLAHPFAPFVTETIWQTLAWESDSILAVQSWPKVTGGDAKKAQQFETVISLVSEVRTINSSLSSPVKAAYVESSLAMREDVELVAKLSKIELQANIKPTGITIAHNDLALLLNLPEEHFIKLQDSLESRIGILEAEVKNLEKRLSNKAYVANAPEKIINDTKQMLEAANANLQKTKGELTKLRKT